jgi:hypothetical protein
VAKPAFDSEDHLAVIDLFLTGLSIDPPVLRSAVGKIREERRLSPPLRQRLEHFVTMHHAQCGGQVYGDLGGPFYCRQCGSEMRAFVSDSDRVEFVPPQRGPRAA